jgi:hypothetical protein
MGETSTHELWPTLITGLRPEEHGLTLEDDGVAWGNPILRLGSTVADFLLPDILQTRIGAWLLTNTEAKPFRTSSTHYENKGIETLFDGHEATAIGTPNYVVDPENEDHEYNLRRSLGDLLNRDPDATGVHTSAGPYKFHEQCLEMSMVRIARARRGLRGDHYELVFAYTSGLDLVRHVTYDMPALQRAAYGELYEFVGELRDDLADRDEPLLVSDHGLQDGVYTDEAMVASTDEAMVEAIASVVDVRAAIEAELRGCDHQTDREQGWFSETDAEEVRGQLEDVGYM